ncbi:MAG: carbamoyltransferase HypF [Candidatus Omnitrophica bacterium]|nr:carbamoyltransferase HypF [Candidatus Omnitrophota bacterium]
MQDTKRLYVEIFGLVQGVGFRPFVHRLARGLNLLGWVKNSSQGVLIEAEGPTDRLETFILRLPREKPLVSAIYSFKYSYLDPVGYKEFQILTSDVSAKKTTLIMPDIATCPECLKEIFDPNDRRYFYPFANCTHCGPRYTIIEGLPYDRPNTSMRRFKMCDECQAEYDNPSSRRFHAQPNACPQCGPVVELWDKNGRRLSFKQQAIDDVVVHLKEGRIVAVKGLGGFHLVCDAMNEESIRQLRRRKHREAKPFALMFPRLEDVRDIVEVSLLEEQLLTSIESPIVLLRKNKRDMGMCLSDNIAPDNPHIGVMLPYTPLHHILLKLFDRPVIATSANISDEPICIHERDAVERLNGIADFFLVHNRPIVHHCDDSIVRLMHQRPMVLRRARGYAPLPVPIRQGRGNILAVGAHLKNSIAMSVNNHVFLSQHIGDLETKMSYDTFERTINAFKSLYDIHDIRIVRDQHDHYFSSQYAQKMRSDCVKVQHHHAHIVSCMVENQLEGTVLGVAWDGTGLGLDHTLWGGEFLKASLESFKRIGTIYPFSLPGGEVAIKEPRRTAVSLLWVTLGDDIWDYQDLPALKSFTAEELKILIRMLTQDVNAPASTSIGRLFDGIASICGLNHINQFEGQAPMALEHCVRHHDDNAAYSFLINNMGDEQTDIINDDNLMWIVDWRPILREIIFDLRIEKTVDIIAEKFHNTLVNILIAIARKAGLSKVVLSGGCFQNQYLLEHAVDQLLKAGFSPYWHQLIPPNDGGIALGQAAVCHYRLIKERGDRES